MIKVGYFWHSAWTAFFVDNLDFFFFVYVVNNECNFFHLVSVDRCVFFHGFWFEKVNNAVSKIFFTKLKCLRIGNGQEQKFFCIFSLLFTLFNKVLVNNWEAVSLWYNIESKLFKNLLFSLKNFSFRNLVFHGSNYWLNGRNVNLIYFSSQQYADGT